MKSIVSILFFFAASALLLSSCDKDENSNSAVNTNDQVFVMKASSSNFVEITLGQIAADSATDPSVKQYGAQMVSDHTAAQQQLQTIASALGLDATATLDAEHQLLRDSLLSLKGRAFDSVYIHSQFRDHEKTIDFFKQHSAHGLQKDLKQYVYETLPELTFHLQSARTISTNY
jgi:putative membrane protein